MAKAKKTKGKTPRKTPRKATRKPLGAVKTTTGKLGGYWKVGG